MNQYQQLQKKLMSIPEISYRLKQTKENPFELIRILTDHIKDLIDQNNQEQLSEYLKITGKIYEEGNVCLRNIIENTFIYSLDHCKTFSHEVNRQNIMNLLPQNLMSAYLHQVYKSGL